MQGNVEIYELKVTLRGTKPPIWRRFHIRSDVTLFKLHQVLQTAMGWTNSHLHQFVVGDLYYGTPDPEFPRPRKNDKKVRLDEALKQPKDRLVYEYDFGDDWTHDVVLERVAEPEPAAKYPQVVAGKRACPPEDCGGIPGYYRLLEVLSREDHPEHDEMLEWVGGEFDPEVFDLNEANVAFHGGWREA